MSNDLAISGIRDLRFADRDGQEGGFSKFLPFDLFILERTSKAMGII